MLNKIVLSLIKNITLHECQYSNKHARLIGHAGDYRQQALMYKDERGYHFKVIGSPYLLAMTKWLSMELENNKLIHLADSNIRKLQENFNLPDNKRQDALIILQLIEQIITK